jgi:hypothetical protein
MLAFPKANICICSPEKRKYLLFIKYLRTFAAVRTSVFKTFSADAQEMRNVGHSQRQTFILLARETQIFAIHQIFSNFCGGCADALLCQIITAGILASYVVPR